MRLFWIMVAGGIGTGLRYGMSLGMTAWMAQRDPRGMAGAMLGLTFPVGTLTINVIGALVLGFLTQLWTLGALNPDLRLILGTGLCGGFTTFSTFELEAQNLISRSEWSPAGVYIMGNLLLGYGAVLLGRALAMRLVGPFSPGGA